MVRADSDTPSFIKVQCADCENEQVIFSHASSEVDCKVCGKTLSIPRGGKSEIDAEILEIVG